MRRIVLASLLVGCSSPPIDVGTDAGAGDATATDADAATDAAQDAAPAIDAATDAPDGACFVSTVGVFGSCMTTSACAALGDRVSTPGYCGGPANVECCTDAPDVGDNPPVPQGWVLMQQSQVTPAMTAWAVAILKDPTTYPMWSTTTQLFGSLDVLARVEWHPPDFQNAAIHRGVTLYVP